MNIFHKVLELWPGHESGTYGRTDGRTDGRTYGTDRGNTLCPSAILRIRGGHKNARVVFLVHDTSLIVMYAPVKFHEYIP